VSVRGGVQGTAEIMNGYYQRQRRRWWVRLLRAGIGTAVVIIALSLAAFGGLMLVTPSVANAPRVAAAQDAAHDVAYPGPPLSSRWVTALLATEDHRFGSEPGVDPYAVGKAVAGVFVHSDDPGGATIYQQLAKLLYTPGESGVTVEAKQVALAVKLRYSFPGSQILRMYADVTYYGSGFYGIEAASCGYFGVMPARLSWPQAAMLAGLVNGPSLDDPLTNPVNGRARELHVISRMVATGALTPAQAAAASHVSIPALLARAGRGCGR
jgi:membrane peptidoglycan carboxypeptidase